MNIILQHKFSDCLQIRTTWPKNTKSFDNKFTSLVEKLISCQTTPEARRLRCLSNRYYMLSLARTPEICVENDYTLSQNLYVWGKRISSGPNPRFLPHQHTDVFSMTLINFYRDGPSAVITCARERERESSTTISRLAREILIAGPGAHEFRLEELNRKYNKTVQQGVVTLRRRWRCRGEWWLFKLMQVGSAVNHRKRFSERERERKIAIDLFWDAEVHRSRLFLIASARA